MVAAPAAPWTAFTRSTPREHSRGLETESHSSSHFLVRPFGVQQVLVFKDAARLSATLVHIGLTAIFGFR